MVEVAELGIVTEQQMHRPRVENGTSNRFNHNGNVELVKSLTQVIPSLPDGSTIAILGIDGQDATIAAKKYAATLAERNIKIVQTSTGLTEATQDSIAALIGNVSSANAVDQLAQIHRILAEQGDFTINLYDPEMSQQKLEAMMEEARLFVLRIDYEFSGSESRYEITGIKHPNGNGDHFRRFPAVEPKVWGYYQEEE